MEGILDFKGVLIELIQCLGRLRTECILPSMKLPLFGMEIIIKLRIANVCPKIRTKKIVMKAKLFFAKQNQAPKAIPNDRKS